MTETINVSGSGEVTAEPETATVSIAIAVEREDVTEVREELASRYEDVEAALKDEGFGEEAVTTADYTVRGQPPRNEDDEHTYYGNHSLQVALDDIDDVGRVIDTAIEAGATDVNDVTFTLSDETRRQCRDEALELAVSEAEHDAEATAAAAGRTVGAIENLSVDRARVNPSQSSGEGLMLAAASPDTTDTSIETGDVSVSASVSVTYRLDH